MIGHQKGFAASYCISGIGASLLCKELEGLGLTDRPREWGRCNRKRQKLIIKAVYWKGYSHRVFGRDMRHKLLEEKVRRKF